MTVNKSLKKMLCATLAGVSVFASVTMFSACTTSHPEVEMKISFNDKTYTLEYKLYRKRAPSTVQHFLELVEKGYYDGLCVHDYNSSSEKLYTGGYTYDSAKTADGGLVEKDYFNIVKDWNMTQTVWDINDDSPVYTLYGEFSDNGFSVTNGSLKQSYGSLTMYYTSKESCGTYVNTKRSDGKGKDAKLYKYNSATSLFYISLSSSSSSSGTKYCTFATLEDDSVEVLDDLKEAIDEYIEDEYEGNTEDFAPTAKVVVDEDDRYVGSDKESHEYSVPVEPIVIKSVKVKSY